jgi:hypothetical protein
MIVGGGTVTVCACLPWLWLTSIRILPCMYSTVSKFLLVESAFHTKSARDPSTMPPLVVSPSTSQAEKRVGSFAGKVE